MAAIGKLAKLGKTLWKGVSYLPKKAHQLQKPFKAPAGGKLSTGKKIANCVFNTTKYASSAGLVGATGAAGYEAYKADNNDSHKEYEEHSLKASKYIDTTLGLLGGFILGGPIGALALGAAAYFTPKDLTVGSATVCKHGGESITFNELRKLKEQERQQKAEAEKPKETPEQQKVVTFESNEITQEELIKALEDAGIETQEGDEVTIANNTLTVKHKDGSEETAQVKIKNDKKPSEIDQKILEILKEKNFEVKNGDKITVDLDKNEIQVTRGDKTHTIKADLTAIKSEIEAESNPEEKTDSTAVKQPTPVERNDSTELNTPAQADSTATAPNAPVAPADSTATAPNAPAATADSTATAPNAPAAPADSTATAPNAPAAPTQAPQQPVQPQAPRNNIFGGSINEISIKEYDVQPKDCLWNIARRELEKANPGVTINNGQVLAQVKEFIRLNPQIKNPDLIYPNQKIKMCA